MKSTITPTTISTTIGNLLFGDERSDALDLDDVDRAALGEHLVIEVRARAPLLAADADAAAVAVDLRVTRPLRPISASVPVRDSAGSRRWLRAIGRRIASEATEQTMKTISEPSVPAPSSAASSCGHRSERDRAEEEEPRGQHLADRERDGDQHPEEPTHGSSLDRGPSAAGRARKSVRRPATSGWRPSRSISSARIPTASAPSMSSSSDRRPSRRLGGATSSSSSIRRKIASCGLVLPCTRDVSTASTSRAWCSTNRPRSRAVFESSPSLSPRPRSSSSDRDRVVEELEVVRRAPRPASSPRRSRTCRRPRPSPRRSAG